jgi:hypothetical protein
VALSADDIRRAFAALSEELEREKQHAEMIVVGGAALVLLFQERERARKMWMCTL